MNFDPSFLLSIEKNPVAGIGKVIKFTFAHLNEGVEGWDETDREVLLEGLALVLSVQEAYKLNSVVGKPTISGSLDQACSQIHLFLNNVLEESEKSSTASKLEELRAGFDLELGKAFSYEFTDGDFARIQELLNELREEVSTSELFEPDHKRRILLKLEKMQVEVHKKVSSFDQFWGLFGTAGVALGKFGEDSKPFVDRVKELTGIVWRTQARAEELPSGTPRPLLGDDCGVDEET